MFWDADSVLWTKSWRERGRRPLLIFSRPSYNEILAPRDAESNCERYIIADITCTWFHCFSFSLRRWMLGQYPIASSIQFTFIPPTGLRCIQRNIFSAVKSRIISEYAKPDKNRARLVSFSDSSQKIGTRYLVRSGLTRHYTSRLSYFVSRCGPLVSYRTHSNRASRSLRISSRLSALKMSLNGRNEVFLFWKHSKHLTGLDKNLTGIHPDHRPT
jgi:hypothetical protein